MEVKGENNHVPVKERFGGEGKYRTTAAFSVFSGEIWSSIG